MNLRNLRYFLMVVEEKNITKAARKLFISQQTLSGVIRRLEEEYRTRLFEREPCMHLTEAGFYMEKFARQVLKMETTLTNQLDDISHELRGHLTIGITPTRARLLLPVFLPVFRCHYPQIELSFSVDGYTSLLKQLQDDNLDAMIATARPKDPGLHDWFLYTDPFSLVVPRPLAVQYLPSLMPSHSSHPANLKMPFHQLPMEERRQFLISVPMIQMVRSTIQKNSESIYHELGLTPYILYSFHDLETVLELSLSSLGCCFSFAQYAEKKLNSISKINGIYGLIYCCSLRKAVKLSLQQKKAPEGAILCKSSSKRCSISTFLPLQLLRRYARMTVLIFFQHHPSPDGDGLMRAAVEAGQAVEAMVSHHR